MLDDLASGREPYAFMDLNATQAAIRAGYSKKTAYSMGHENLKKPEISAAISEAQVERSKRTEITQDWVLQTIFDTVERCKQAQPVVDRKGTTVFVETPSGNIAPAYTFSPAAVLKGAELAGKHLGMFPNKHEVTGKDGGLIETKEMSTMEAARHIAFVLDKAARGADAKMKLDKMGAPETDADAEGDLRRECAARGHD